jgi:arsenate reductase (glutaredoxin)
MTITVYQKPTCTTCRQVYTILKDSGVDFRSVNYYINPLSRSRLKMLLRKMKMKPSDLLRTKEAAYKRLKLGTKKRTNNELIDLMVRYPDLIQRPIAEKGEQAILARPADRIRQLL